MEATAQEPIKQSGTAMSTVLVIEDDSAIRRGLVDALGFHGYTVLEAGDGMRGMQLALSAECDLILLDVVMPGPDGLEILQAVREKRPTLPIIMLTAKGEEADRVTGLKRGADDYVVKPFSLKELLARVQAVLRRSPERPAEIKTVKWEGGSADLARREVTFKNGAREELSEREGEILTYLAQNAGRAISRDELLQRVWRMDPNKIETRTIDMHVARLREKLHDSASEPQVILTVRGKGYKFVSA